MPTVSWYMLLSSVHFRCLHKLLRKKKNSLFCICNTLYILYYYKIGQFTMFQILSFFFLSLVQCCVFSSLGKRFKRDLSETLWLKKNKQKTKSHECNNHFWGWCWQMKETDLYQEKKVYIKNYWTCSKARCKTNYKRNTHSYQTKNKHRKKMKKIPHTIQHPPLPPQGTNFIMAPAALLACLHSLTAKPHSRDSLSCGR